MNKLNFNEEEPKKKSKFNLYNLFYDNQKDAKDDLHVLDNPNLPTFFKFFKKYFSRVFYINLLMVLGNFPIFFFLLGLSGLVSNATIAPSYPVYASLRGVAMFDHSAAIGALLDTYGVTTNITVPTIWTYICYGLGALVIFTWGFVCTGTTYILRSTVRGEPVFLWADFWYAIKKNWKQSLIFGLIDAIVLLMLGFDLFYYNMAYSADTFYSIMYFLSWAMAIIYFMMRMYTYLMIVTFDLSMGKLIKNSLFFVFLGIKRNILVVLGVVILCFFEWLLFSISFTFAIGAILPFVYLFGLVGLMSVYAAYPKIKEIMIDPYYKEHPNEAPYSPSNN